MKIKKGVSVSLLGLILWMACNSEPVYDYQEIRVFPNERWKRTDTISFRFTPLTEGKKNIYFYLENTSDFPYANLYLIVRTRRGETLHADTLEYRMADGRGRWLGRKVRHNFENLLVFKTGVSFKKGEEVEIIPEFATRSAENIEGDEELKGVAKLGIIIENVPTKSKK